MEKKALQDNLKLYEKYLNITKYRPNRVIFENGDVKISSMKMNMKKKNLGDGEENFNEKEDQGNQK